MDASESQAKVRRGASPLRGGWLRRWDTWSKSLRSKIGRRFAFMTIACSTLLAILMTIIQLGFDFRTEKSEFDAALQKVELAILPSLTESLWVLDDALVISQLSGIAQLAGVYRVEIQGADENFVVSNTEEPRGTPTEFPIVRNSGGQTSELGILVVHSSYDPIIRDIFRRGLVVLATNFLKTICIAFVILYLFQRLVGQHIFRLAEFAQRYDPKSIGQRLEFDPSGLFGDRVDLCEFGALQDAINGWSVTTETHVEQLQNANREQAEFTYAISHDLKSPINTISMLIDELEATVNVDDGARGILDDMKTTNRRMSGLVVDILDYSRMVESEIELANIDVALLIAEIEQDFAADLLVAEAKIFTEDLPTIPAHPAQLRILFQNLISNAVKFRSADRSPIVRIAAKRLQGGWEITVSDNGIGIPEEHREGVFGLFKRLHTRSVYDGSGLGLTVCRRIMSNHGGTISVQTGIDGGTAVELVFPEARAAKHS